MAPPLVKAGLSMGIVRPLAFFSGRSDSVVGRRPHDGRSRNTIEKPNADLRITETLDEWHGVMGTC
jgi:hypothetical protein